MLHGRTLLHIVSTSTSACQPRQGGNMRRAVHKIFATRGAIQPKSTDRFQQTGIRTLHRMWAAIRRGKALTGYLTWQATSGSGSTTGIKLTTTRPAPKKIQLAPPMA